MVTKFNAGGVLFDEQDPAYVAAWKAALDKLIPTGKLFEINTGVIFRGYHKEPYPARPILKEIVARGGKIIIPNDCHRMEGMGYGFYDAIQYAKECGATEIYTLSGSPVKQVKIAI